LPPVSIIIPCFNERRFIEMCLDSVCTNDYPDDLVEVLVVDGMSEDGTRAIVTNCVKKYPSVRLLDNPKKITPAALNMGIAEAKGDVIIRIDAHARVEKDYISRCVKALKEYRADNVGGIMKTVPQIEGLLGGAIVLALSHRFGVGNSFFRIHTGEPRWVDTVFGGCYRREVFDRIGLFNEALVRGQDMEFNLRLRKDGGRTLIVPDIVSYYYAPSNLKSFWKQSWGNGVWAILPFLYSPIMPVSWRHLVPLAFVLGIFGSAVLALLSLLGVWMLTGLLGAYGVASLLVSTQLAVRERDFRCLVIMPFVFASLHLGYGLGSLWGLLRALAQTLIPFVYKPGHVNCV